MMIFEFEDTPIQNAQMKVVGVGGAGGNAVNRMVDEDLEGVEFISANTDAQALKNSRAQVTLQSQRELHFEMHLRKLTRYFLTLPRALVISYVFLGKLTWILQM